MRVKSFYAHGNLLALQWQNVLWLSPDLENEFMVYEFKLHQANGRQMEENISIYKVHTQ